MNTSTNPAVQNGIKENLDANNIVETADESIPPRYKDSTYDVSSRVAYLIGVGKRVFEIDCPTLALPVYQEMDGIKAARIIRHLCIIRNALLRGRKAIAAKMIVSSCNITSLPDLIPQDSIQRLKADGVNFFRKTNTSINMHIVELNRLIDEHIGKCLELFPSWLNREYIKDLFKMPGGNTDNGVTVASKVFYANMRMYPYKCYINWKPKDMGNLLSCDKRFVIALYEMHGDTFENVKMVTDASAFVKNGIHEYISGSGKVVMVVDCENANPYNLCAALRSLDQESTDKISSIIVFDDVHTTSLWRILDRFTSIPVEHVMINRIKGEKSLVDTALVARTCSEFYKNDVDSFILVSSDSDYWSLISHLAEARFMVMAEHDKLSPQLKAVFVEAGIFYCYLDDFYAGNTADIVDEALLYEVELNVTDRLTANIKSVLNEAIQSVQMELDEEKKKDLYNKYISGLCFRFDSDGNLTAERSAH